MIPFLAMKRILLSLQYWDVTGFLVGKSCFCVGGICKRPSANAWEFARGHPSGMAGDKYPMHDALTN